LWILKIAWSHCGGKCETDSVKWAKILEELQKPYNFNRPLDEDNIEALWRVIHLPDNSDVPYNAFIPFWTWIYQTKKTINAYLQDCWLRSISHKNKMYWIIEGFIHRDKIDRKLKSLGRNRDGTFMIRFSERFAGSVVISYLSTNQTIEHLILAPQNFDAQSIENRKLSYFIQGEYNHILTTLFPGIAKREVFPKINDLNVHDGGYIRHYSNHQHKLSGPSSPNSNSTNN